MPTRVHPYVDPLIAALPAGWDASLESTTYDKGAVGEPPMLMGKGFEDFIATLRS